MSDLGLEIKYQNPPPLQLRCYKCKNVTDKVIQVIEKDKEDPYGFNSLYYCKTCFKNFLNT
jgi:hypothetical protein